MLCKKLIVRSSMILAVCAGALFAQLTVSQDPADEGMFRTIQEAVNAAEMGQTITILDTKIYKEQVTIDGRDESPWDGIANQGGTTYRVKGGKHGITIRSKNPTDRQKPVIMWKDTLNSWPRTQNQAKGLGELPGVCPSSTSEPSACTREPGSGNFETAGALRIIRASGVTIEGITIDGGGAAPFGWTGVWGASALTHGNAAITLVVSSDVIIRNCDIRNGYNGINVKDRNTGGVFGNKNPADNDATIPLSGFGRVGNHLIEHNRIYGNSVGLFFESAWDLASTVRYNLIYDNVHSDEARKVLGIGPMLGEKNAAGERAAGYSPAGSAFPDINNMAAGAIMVKDMVYSPLAIHNNTFYGNYMNLIGHWKVGAPHLIFNNIFGPSPVPYIGEQNNAAKYANFSFMSADGAFTYRMHHNTFSIYERIQVQAQNYNLHHECTPTHYDTIYVDDITVWNEFAKAEKGPLNFAFWSLCPAANPQSPSGVEHGALLTEGTRGFPTESNNRWLEVGGLKITPNAQQTQQGIEATMTFPALFQSVDPENARFLWPIWDDPLVVKYIKNKGWQAAGIRNSDGQIADLGAIPSTGKQQPVNARIRPTDVVQISGGTRAVATFNLSVEGGQFNNPRVSFLRWVAPLPEVEDNFGGSQAPIIPQNAIYTMTSTEPVKIGNNSFQFTLPRAMTDADQYGFFEIIITGTDAAGNEVTSTVGFLPYRRLDYKLHITLLDASGKPLGVIDPQTLEVTTVPEVKAGEQVQMMVTAMERQSDGKWKEFTRVSGGTPITAAYGLASDPTSRIWRVINPIRGNPLEEDEIPNSGSAGAGRYTKTYDPVYFTKAGDETITGAGEWRAGKCDGQSQGVELCLGFLGTLPVKVLPGDPDAIAFVAPISDSQRGQTPPETINDGSEYAAQVVVTDKWKNPVGAGHTVNMKSESKDIGDVLVGATGNTLANGDDVSMTTGEDGIARFRVVVTNGKTNDVFKLTASAALTSGTKTDEGSLRIGRPNNIMRIFYPDTDPNSVTWSDDFSEYDRVNGMVGQWVQIYIKATAPGDMVLTDWAGSAACVVASPGLLLSDGSENVVGNQLAVPVVNGVGRLWVGASEAVINGELEVTPKVSLDCDGANNNSLARSTRSEIYFEMPSSSISYAAVFANGNGRGRPDAIVIAYDGEGAGGFDDGGWALPDSVSITWPSANSPKVTVSGAAITALDSRRIQVSLASVSASLPTGYTAIDGSGLGIVTVCGGHMTFGCDGVGNVIDSIGLLITDSDDGIPDMVSPRLVENLDDASTEDVVMIRFSEDPLPATVANFAGASLMVIPSPSWSGDMATGGTAVSVSSVTAASGGWYRFVVPRGAIEVGQYIRINPAAGVTDFIGNPVSEGNRWVKVGISEVEPTVVSSRYVDNDADGLIDAIYVTFNKNVSSIPDWFKSMSIKWGTLEGAVSSPADQVGIVDGAPNTIAINVGSAFPAARKDIRTGGAMSLSITYVNIPDIQEWKPVSGFEVNDNAAPVLVSAKFVMGKANESGESEPNTLELVYSEDISDVSLGVSNPVVVLNGGTPRTPALSNPTSSISDSYRKVTYIVTDMAGFDPAPNDSAYINPLAGISDKEANNQDNANNRRVPLLAEFQTEWRVSAKNNPFPSGGQTVIVVSTGVAGVATVETRFVILDNMGKVVIDETVKNIPGQSFVEWAWRGHNKNGRLVGTGTYLLRTSSKISGVITEKPTHSESKKIGFVRKKGGV